MKFLSPLLFQKIEVYVALIVNIRVFPSPCFDVPKNVNRKNYLNKNICTAKKKKNNFVFKELWLAYFRGTIC